MCTSGQSLFWKDSLVHTWKHAWRWLTHPKKATTGTIGFLLSQSWSKDCLFLHTRRTLETVFNTHLAQTTLLLPWYIQIITRIHTSTDSQGEFVENLICKFNWKYGCVSDNFWVMEPCSSTELFSLHPEVTEHRTHCHTPDHSGLTRNICAFNITPRQEQPFQELDPERRYWWEVSATHPHLVLTSCSQLPYTLWVFQSNEYDITRGSRVLTNATAGWASKNNNTSHRSTGVLQAVRQKRDHRRKSERRGKARANFLGELRHKPHEEDNHET